MIISPESLSFFPQDLILFLSYATSDLVPLRFVVSTKTIMSHPKKKPQSNSSFQHFQRLWTLTRSKRYCLTGFRYCWWIE
uniref:Uncharacterized protein n=1 Tax=Brassica oleracea var. oleracea TaxID=109376 RepID=A0A0D3C151_BRAOL